MNNTRLMLFLILMIGVIKEQLLLLKIKEIVVHVGHSPPLVTLKANGSLLVTN